MLPALFLLCVSVNCYIVGGMCTCVCVCVYCSSIHSACVCVDLCPYTNIHVCMCVFVCVYTILHGTSAPMAALLRCKVHELVTCYLALMISI